MNEGHYGIAQILIENNGDLEAKTKCLRTALHIACMRGKADFAKLLIDKGAKVDDQDIEGNTCLHYAAE